MPGLEQGEGLHASMMEPSLSTAKNSKATGALPCHRACKRVQSPDKRSHGQASGSTHHFSVGASVVARKLFQVNDLVVQKSSAINDRFRVLLNKLHQSFRRFKCNFYDSPASIAALNHTRSILVLELNSGNSHENQESLPSVSAFTLFCLT